MSPFGADLNAGPRESAVTGGHSSSDVSLLYSWQRFVMRLQRTTEDLSPGPVAPGGRAVQNAADGVSHHSPGAGAWQREWRLISMLNSSYRVVPPGAAVMSEERGAVAQRLAAGGTLNKSEARRCQKQLPGNGGACFWPHEDSESELSSQSLEGKEPSLFGRFFSFFLCQKNK